MDKSDRVLGIRGKMETLDGAVSFVIDSISMGTTGDISHGDLIMCRFS